MSYVNSVILGEDLSQYRVSFPSFINIEIRIVEMFVFNRRLIDEYLYIDQKLVIYIRY